MREMDRLDLAMFSPTLFRKMLLSLTDENCVWYSPVPTLVYNRMGKFARIVFRIVESSVAATLKSHQSAVSAGNELGTVVGVCVVSVLFYAAGVICKNQGNVERTEMKKMIT